MKSMFLQLILSLALVTGTNSNATEDPSPELQISQKGKLLYETNFADIKGWRISNGTWEPGNSELSATQTEGEKHSAHLVTNQGRSTNVIIEFEVFIGDASTIEMTIDDKPKKLGRIALNAKSFRGMQTHRTDAPEKPFNVVQASFALNQWHKICVEILDNQIVAQTGEYRSSSIDGAWSGKPKRLGLLVKKGPGKFRNLKVWEALPKEQ